MARPPAEVVQPAEREQGVDHVGSLFGPGSGAGGSRRLCARRARQRRRSSRSHSAASPVAMRSVARCSVSGSTVTRPQRQRRQALASAPAGRARRRGRAGDDGLGPRQQHGLGVDRRRRLRQAGKHVARAADLQRLAQQVAGR